MSLLLRNNLIDFNGMSTCLELLYALRLGNYIHFMFIVSFWSSFFSSVLHVHKKIRYIPNPNNLQIDLFDPEIYDS